MIEDGFFGFGNGGVTLNTINDFDFANIKKEIEKIKLNFSVANDASNYLIGHLENSYDVIESKPTIERIVKTIIKNDNNLQETYKKALSILPAEEVNSVDLCLDKCWVNFQQKYEFQPIHDHSGVYSFIIFYQIPFDINDEKIFSPGKKANENLSGMLNFHYADYAGVISSMSIPADKHWEKRIFVFPAKLKHSVYPYYSSDGFRITISGNMTLTTKEQ